MLDSIDPVRDLEIINEELMLKDIATVSAEVEKLEKVINREKHRKPELVRSLFHFALPFSFISFSFFMSLVYFSLFFSSLSNLM